jgi:hypothetical protein
MLLAIYTSTKAQGRSEICMGRRTKGLDNIKNYLKSPPILMPPQDKKSFKLYLSANEEAIDRPSYKTLKEKSESYIL